MPRCLAALAALACCLSVSAFCAGGAEATEYANHVGIESGANFVGPLVTLFASETVGVGQGLGCAGIKGVSGVVCEVNAGEFVTAVIEKDIRSEPYIHNHSTFRSFFNGWYYT